MHIEIADNPRRWRVLVCAHIMENARLFGQLDLVPAVAEAVGRVRDCSILPSHHKLLQHERQANGGSLGRTLVWFRALQWDRYIR